MTGHAMIRRPVLPRPAQPALAQSMRGPVQRDGTPAQVGGDVGPSDLAPGASAKGRNIISATWIGQVEQGSCGKEIRGTWNNA